MERIDGDSQFVSRPLRGASCDADVDDACQVNLRAHAAPPPPERPVAELRRHCSVDDLRRRLSNQGMSLRGTKSDLALRVAKREAFVDASDVEVTVVEVDGVVVVEYSVTAASVADANALAARSSCFMRCSRGECAVDTVKAHASSRPRPTTPAARHPSRTRSIRSCPTRRSAMPS